MFLTPEQLEEIRRILTNGATALSVTIVGSEVDDAKIKELIDGGYIDEQNAPSIVRDSYLAGRAVSRNPELGQSYHRFRSWMDHAPIVLSEVERAAVQHAQERAGEFIVGLGQRMSARVGPLAVQAGETYAAEVRAGLQDELAKRIAERHAVNSVETGMRQLTEDYVRDWRRIASTESQYAHQTGYLETVVKDHGEDELMAKIPEDTACKSCLRLYLGPDGKPIARPASWWREQGTNVGLKERDWNPTMGPVHPWCSCRLLHVPAGMTLNDDWDLVPEEVEVEEDAEEGVEKSMELSKGGAPAGFTPAPGSRHGAFRKRSADGWDYWYPEGVSDAHQHIDQKRVGTTDRLEQHRAAVRIGGEYEEDNGRYVVVLPDPSHPGKVRTQTFDSDGFTGHHTYDDLEALVKDTVPYRKPWKETPGVLDKLSRTDQWADGMARNLVVQTLNSLGYYHQQGDVGLINRYVDKHGFRAAADSLRGWSETQKELSADTRRMLSKAAALWDRTTDLIKSRKLHYRTTFQGLPISIENRKGSKRHWYDPHSKTEGTTTMRNPYGYIRLTEGADGEHVDCYLGNNEKARFVYVVHQMKGPTFKDWDEDKIMIGFGSLAEAKRAYLQHYTDHRFYGSASIIPAEKFAENVMGGEYHNTKITKSERQLPSHASGFYDLFKSGVMYVPPRPEVGTMGNYGEPARTSADSVSSKPVAGHPGTAEERKKRKKLDRKRARELMRAKREAVIGVMATPVRKRTKVLPALELMKRDDIAQNRLFFDAETTKRFESRKDR